MTASDDDLPTQIHPSPAQPAGPMPPAAAAADGNSLPLGTRLAEFELTRTLGEGGFGIVYLAWDHSLQRNVALKEYMPSQLAARGAGTEVNVKSERYRDTFEAGLKSFINEARLLAQFDHPALVKVYRFWEANGTAYMVMPFYEGQTLKDTLKGLAQPPDEAWLRGLLAPLSEALRVIHGEQCFHRDIAPDNIILLGSHTRPLLLDFGAARRVISDMTQALTVILKPGYAPLEQYAEVPHMKQGPWTDLYALAAVVYFCITGRTPPPSVGRMMGDTYVPLQQAAAGRYSDAFLRAIDRALAVKPEDRPQSVSQLMAEIAGGTAVGPAPAPAWPAADDDRTIIRPAGPAAWPAAAPHAQGGPAAPPLATPPATGPAAGPAAATRGAGTTASPASAAKPSRTPLIVGAAGLGLVGIGVAAFLMLSPAQAPRRAGTPAAPVTTSPAPGPTEPAGITPGLGTGATPAPVPAPVAESPAPPASVDPSTDFDRVISGQTPGFSVELATRKTQLQIGKDRLSFTLKSARAGYYQILALAPEGTLVQLLPNDEVAQRRIKAGETLTLPGSTFPLDTVGPPGAEHLLAIVSAVPRDLSGLKIGKDSGMLVLAVGARAASLLGDRVQQPAYLGKPVCPASGDCPVDYGAARLTLDIVN